MNTLRFTLAMFLIIMGWMVSFGTRQAQAAQIMSIDFEQGSFVGQAALVADGNDLVVSPQAALANTSYGLAATIDDTNLIYVYYSLASPVTTPVLRARFYLDPHSVFMAAGSEHNIFILINSSSSFIAGIAFGRLDDNTSYDVYGTLALNSTGYHAQTAPYPISDAPHYIEMEIRRASSNTASDGLLQLYIDGVRGPSVTNNNYAVMNNFGGISLGANSNIDPTTRGTYYLDQVVVRNDALVIGPVTPNPPPSITPVAGDADNDQDVDILDLFVLSKVFNKSVAVWDWVTHGIIDIFNVNVIFSKVSW